MWKLSVLCPDGWVQVLPTMGEINPRQRSLSLTGVELLGAYPATGDPTRADSINKKSKNLKDRGTKWGVGVSKLTSIGIYVEDKERLRKLKRRRKKIPEREPGSRRWVGYWETDPDLVKRAVDALEREMAKELK